MRALAPLLMLSLLACAPRKALKEGDALAEDGRDFAAALRYLEGLDRKPGHAKLTAALNEVAPSAWEIQLARAAEAEEAEKWDKAQEEYEALARFAQRATRAGVEGLDEAAALEKVAEMKQAAAQRRYDRARGLEAKGQWSEAIRLYSEANALVPGFEDAVRRVALCHDGWGDELVGAASFREAAGHFSEAAKGGVEGAAAKEAGLLAGLGRYHLGQGACRRSVFDLRAAKALAPKAGLDDTLAEAVACATHPAAVRPVRNQVDDTVLDNLRERFGVDRQAEAADIVQDAFRERLVSGASEFLPVLYAEDIQGGAKGLQRAADYLIRLQLKDLTHGRQLPDRIARQDEAEWGVPCGEDLCVEYGPLLWNEYSKTHWGAVDVKVAAAESKGDVTLLDGLVTKTVEHTARWADDFTVGGQPVVVGAELAPGVVVVSPELLALAQAARTPQDPWELTQLAARDAGVEAAGRVLATLDVEEPWQDPPTMEWAPLQ